MLLLLSLLLFAFAHAKDSLFEVIPTDLELQVHDTGTVKIHPKAKLNGSYTLTASNSTKFSAPSTVILEKDRDTMFNVTGLEPSTHDNNVLQFVKCETRDGGSCPFDPKQIFVRVMVVRSKALSVIIQIVGWLYFAAWSVSFYPQIFLNIKRKSVIGLNFDFLTLNIIGFFAYTIYNLLLFYDDEVIAEYDKENAMSPPPVLLNDVVFAVHALFACVVTAVQACIFERGAQRVSRPCIAFAALLLLAGIIPFVLRFFKLINLLNVAQTLSFVKMAVTLSKYIPQAYFNFARQSTVGWSIGNVLLDFMGGSLAILQMALQAINCASGFSGFIGNPVKFGLGLVSIVFDILFMVQHYVLYTGVKVANNTYGGIDGVEGDGEADSSAEAIDSADSSQPIVTGED